METQRDSVSLARNAFREAVPVARELLDHLCIARSNLRLRPSLFRQAQLRRSWRDSGSVFLSQNPISNRVSALLCLFSTVAQVPAYREECTSIRVTTRSSFQNENSRQVESDRWKSAREIPPPGRCGSLHQCDKRKLSRIRS